MVRSFLICVPLTCHSDFRSRALILHEVHEAETPKTLLHLRFRGKIAATGLKRKLLVAGGEIMDHITTAPMLTGLAERAEHSRIH